MIEYGVSVTPTDNFGDASLYHYILYDTANERFLYIDPLDNGIGWTESAHTILESDHFMIHKDNVLLDQVMSIIKSSPIYNNGQFSTFPAIIENNRKMAIDWKVGFSMEAENIDTGFIYAPYIPIRNAGYIPGLGANIGNYAINGSASGGITVTGTVSGPTAASINAGVGALSTRGVGSINGIPSMASYNYKVVTYFDGMEYIVGEHISIDDNDDEYFDGYFRYTIYDSDADMYMTKFNGFGPNGSETHSWKENITSVDGFFKLKEGYNEKDLCTFWKDYFHGDYLGNLYYVPITIDQHHMFYVDLKNSRRLINEL
jgi:hypothetical protein